MIHVGQQPMSFDTFVVSVVKNIETANKRTNIQTNERKNGRYQTRISLYVGIAFRALEFFSQKNISW